MRAQKKVYDWILLCLLVSLFCFYSIRGYFFLTDGFSKSSITLPYTLEGFKSEGLSEEEVRLIFDQSFHYLGKGIQSYVFLSEDGTTVIKFIKAKHFRGIEKKREEKKKLLERIFKSWQIALNEIKETTGVMYLHFPEEGEQPLPIRLVDKLGISHHVEGEKLIFLLQKRALPLSQYLEQNNRKSANLILSRLLQGIVEENQKGIRDLDPTLLQNTGVIEEKPVHIDVSDFIHETLPKSQFAQDLFNRTYRLRAYLSEHYPELERQFTKELESIIGQKVDTLRPTIGIIEEGD